MSCLPHMQVMILQYPGSFFYDSKAGSLMNFALPFFPLTAIGRCLGAVGQKKNWSTCSSCEARTQHQYSGRVAQNYAWFASYCGPRCGSSTIHMGGALTQWNERNWSPYDNRNRLTYWQWRNCSNLWTEPLLLYQYGTPMVQLGLLGKHLRK